MNDHRRRLLDLMPDFDPRWSDEMQEQWLAWADQFFAWLVPNQPLSLWQRAKAWLGKPR